ncbi:MAG: hypothetical protein B7X48_07950 [Acidiphilium sp. 34-60-192]|nr:MAG: hypothetical protein B7X48_07950 [Acidiphilium sp. 34-60-192]
MNDLADINKCRQFDQIILSSYKSAFNFTERSNRSEFWLFILFWLCLYLTYSLFWAVAGWTPGWLSSALLAFYWVFKVLYIISFLPYIAVQIRRLHDSGRSAFWAIGTYAGFGVGLLPAIVHDTSDSNKILGLLLLIGATIAWFIMVVFDLMAGDAGANKFGPAPSSSRYH